MGFLNTDFLVSDEIRLVVERLAPGDPIRKWVPAYHFYICDLDGHRMGTCDLRIGHTEGLYYGGHIGYAIAEEYRGHHYAAKACKLLFDLARKHELGYVYITCDPENIASRKTCEYLDGKFLGIVELPLDNDMRIQLGDTHKCIFKFEL